MKLIQIKTQGEEKARIKKAAEKVGLDLSSFMRSLALEKANLILQNTKEELNASDSKLADASYSSDGERNGKK
jgi:uncharacterized protein (DUF1778 family)